MIVEEDLDVAAAAARLPRHGASAYHLQQAAEKLIKALLVLVGQPFRRTHDIDDLAARVLPIYPQFTTTLNSLRHLTIWGVAYRYPGLEDEAESPPTAAELDSYITLLTNFAAEVRDIIGAA